MRICLLTNQDLLADPFPADDWPCDPRPFYPDAQWEVECLSEGDLGRAGHPADRRGLRPLFQPLRRRRGPEHSGHRSRADAGRARRRIHRRDVRILRAVARGDEGRPAGPRASHTPDYVLARCEADVERAADTLRFPLFVKHYSSYSSVDLSRRSRVSSPAGLRQQARKIMRRHGAALIEEFIEGTECTVLVAENPDDPAHPKTYTPLQYRFPDGESFKHSDMKWVDYDKMSAFPVDDPALDARLRDVSARFFVALNGASFGRCDLRVDRTGTPFMLEINPNCGVYYPSKDAGSADLCLLHDPDGHVGFTRQLIQAALQRHSKAVALRSLPRDVAPLCV